ncbi:hypothetical protein KC865_04375 [Candidatus Kaiserbacteria bacterium]|nr:hypothetical protein [Candidatus Kaiserbacteria bacterium]USN92352.1 MAG: hypothetical protein H6782_00860 [Candidatus Nomurabacteria bacterium]
MKKFLKENVVIIIAFSLPVLFIVVIALSSLLPSLFISTNYNFVYSSCTDGYGYYSYRCENYLQKRHSVVNGRLVLNDIDPTLDSDNDDIPDVKEGYTVRLFLHDTKLNESREITLEEAQSLNLNELITSPDGVSVSSHYSRGGDFFILFDGGSSYGLYLVKGNAKRKLNLINDRERYYYNDDFQFIGWVLPGRN